MPINFNSQLPSLFTAGQDGGFAVNSGGIATFPGDSGYNDAVGKITGKQSTISKIGSAVGSAASSYSKAAKLDKVGQVASNMVTGAAIMSDPARWVAVIIGLICIAGGILMFKPARDVIINSSKKAAELAAVTA